MRYAIPTVSALPDSAPGSWPGTGLARRCFGPTSKRAYGFRGPAHPIAPCRWTTLDVRAFLATMPGQNFEMAAETCFENCVDGKTLAALTPEQLELLLHLDADEALTLTGKLKQPSMQPPLPAPTPAGVGFSVAKRLQLDTRES